MKIKRFSSTNRFQKYLQEIIEDAVNNVSSDKNEQNILK